MGDRGSAPWQVTTGEVALPFAYLYTAGRSPPLSPTRKEKKIELMMGGFSIGRISLWYVFMYKALDISLLLIKRYFCGL
jgi:hypothetical protein